MTRRRDYTVFSTSAPSVTISLDNLLHNISQLRSLMPPAIKIIAVVKDSAYGCGARRIAHTLEKRGKVDFFAVASPFEAFALRRHGIKSSILVLGKATREELTSGVDRKIVFTCNGLQDLVRWQTYDLQISLHCNIDTGMSRLGFRPEDIPECIERIGSSPGLHLSGLFTHMASADVPGTATVNKQLERFAACCELFKAADMYPDTVHAANSATLQRFPEVNFTHIRPGISLYGCRPDPRQSFTADVRPVLSLAGPVVSIRKVTPGTPVSYGGNYLTTRTTCIATIGVGYAHGVPRYLSNRGNVLIGGHYYRIVGNVTMDYIMVDAGPEPAFGTGDEAIVTGSQGSAAITPDDIAVLGNTIGYEILCNISTAIRRTYILDGNPVAEDPGTFF